MALSSYARQQSPSERMAPLRVLRDQPETLLINEIYHSLQGEGSRAGRPCTFVRLTGCHLRCHYCDSESSFQEGTSMTIEAIVDRLKEWNTSLIQITGGEPLLQKAVYPLMSHLCDLDYELILETSGAISVAQVDPRVTNIIDVKTPSSGESSRNLDENLQCIRSSDELKFVISDHADYLFAVDKLKSTIWTRPQSQQPIILFSPEADSLPPTELAEWILSDQLNIRFQLQMHKVLWGNKRGV